MKCTAVFLDRDDTIIEDRGYVRNPDDVKLIPGAAEAIRRFALAGYRVVLVSNQSGVARGLISEGDLRRVHARLEELLEQSGARLDAAYYCPYFDGPQAVVEKYRQASELRKPEPGMILQAARDLDLDLPRSWMIGDAPCDVEAGRRAGCRTAFLRNGRYDLDLGSCRSTVIVDNLEQAADMLEREMKTEPLESELQVPGLGSRHEKNAGPGRDDAAEAGTRDDAKSGNSYGPAAGGASGDAAPSRPPGGEDAAAILKDIREQLERSQRRRQQQDFSLLRLFGALLQMLAIVAAIWGAAALIAEQSRDAAARLALACYLQLASLSAFAVDRFK